MDVFPLLPGHQIVNTLLEEHKTIKEMLNAARTAHNMNEKIKILEEILQKSKNTRKQKTKNSYPYSNNQPLNETRLNPHGNLGALSSGQFRAVLST